MAGVKELLTHSVDAQMVSKSAVMSLKIRGDQVNAERTVTVGREDIA